MSRRTLITGAHQSLAIAALSSTALLTAEKNDPEDHLATEEDYAALHFNALDVNLSKAREVYENMWTPLAVGLALLGKSPDECQEVVALMGNNVETFDTMINTLSEGIDWYRNTADALDGALVRFLAGAARHSKARI